MAFSTQREVSDGTLVDVRLQIEFIDREDINVFVNDVPKYVGVDWDWVNDTLFQMRVPVPAGQELLVQRSTALDGVLNVFVAGASFDDPTMDENFRQMLFIAQEAREGATLEEIFNNLNMHGYKVQNMGAGTEPGDAINYQQYMDDALGAGAARNQAQAAATTALGYRDAAAASATLSDQRANDALTHRNAANASATAAAGSASASQTSRLASEAARDAALGYRDAASTYATTSQTSANASAASATDANNALLGVRGAAVPTGSVQFWPGLRANIPQGYIPLDGQISLRSEYPSIWALVVAGAFAATTEATWLAGNRGYFSTGDGSTTFRWPDYNAYSHTDNPGGFFLRGGVDAKVGGVTQDAMQGHKHRSTALSSNSGATNFNAAFGGDTFSLSGLGAFSSIGSGFGVYTGPSDIADPVNGVPRNATETRPVHVSGVWIMKAFGEVLNPGSYDAASASLAINNLSARVLTVETRDQWQYNTIRSLGNQSVIDLVDEVPTWATEVELLLNDVGLQATADIGLQFYHGGGPQVTGYVGSTNAMSGSNVGAAVWDQSMRVTFSAYEAARRTNGKINFSLRGGVGWGGRWIITGQHQSLQVSTLGVMMNGVQTLPAVRWGLRLFVVNGSTTFASGDISLRWRR